MLQVSGYCPARGGLLEKVRKAVQLLIDGQQVPRVTSQNENHNSASYGGTQTSEQELGPLGETQHTQLPMLAAGNARWAWGMLLMATSHLITVTKAGMLTVPVPYLICQHKDLNNSGWLSQVMYVGVSQNF